MEDEYYFIPEIHYYKEEDLNHYRNEKQKRLKLPNKNCAGKTNSAITNGFFESFTDKIYYDYIPYIPCNYKPLEIIKNCIGITNFMIIEPYLKIEFSCIDRFYFKSKNNFFFCEIKSENDDLNINQIKILHICKKLDIPYKLIFIVKENHKIKHFDEEKIYYNLNYINKQETATEKHLRRIIKLL